jgi:site-specific DNA-methyltransferase (adenine-specific)
LTLTLKDYLFYQEDLVDIYCGDVRDILPLFPDDSVDMVLTDPPYGVGIEYGKFEDTLENVQELIAFFLPEVMRISSGAVVFPSGQFSTELFLFKNYPPKWRICWYKGAQSTLSAIGYCDWEMIMVYGKKVHNNIHDHFYAKPEAMGKFGHPCPKSTKWAEWLIDRFDGKVILDPFAGSGTTCVSAKKYRRKSIGIDIESKNCEIAKERVKDVISYNPGGIVIKKMKLDK